MTTEKKKQASAKIPLDKWSVYGILLVIFTFGSFALWAMGGLVGYPTAAHREVDVKISELTGKAWAQQDIEKLDEALQSPELIGLQNTPEAKYSSAVNLISGLIQIAVWVVAIGFVYSYLRRKRISKDQAMTIAVIDGLSAVILFPFTFILAGVFYPASMSIVPGVDNTIVVVAAVPFVFGFSVLLTYIVARIFQWRYNRKYNFTVE